MRRLDTDIDKILSLEDKRRILREIQQDDLLDLFKKGYTPQYKQVDTYRQPEALDQQISITINQAEKDYISKELLEIRKQGPGASLSSFIRNRANLELDISQWASVAKEALKELNSDDWNPIHLRKEKRKLIQLLDNEEDSGSEDAFFNQKKLDEVNDKIRRVTKQQAKRGFRVAGRVTYAEANLIRYRAARLTISVADYIRFSIFGYLPFSDEDSHLSLEARKRFYISILDVYTNGWGNPPEPPRSDSSVYLKEIKLLKQKIARYEQFIKENGLSENF